MGGTGSLDASRGRAVHWIMRSRTPVLRKTSPPRHANSDAVACRVMGA